MREPADEQIEAFKAAWHRADAEGRQGERVRDGLRAVLADAVVLNRDDIPGQLVAELLEAAHAASADGFPTRADLLADHARLLSGGSPAAPEDDTDGRKS